MTRYADRAHVAAILLAAQAAFDTDDGRTILQRLATGLRRQRFVLLSAVTLDRLSGALGRLNQGDGA